MSRSRDFRWPEHFHVVTRQRNRVRNGSDPVSRYWPTDLDLAVTGPVAHEHARVDGQRLMHSHGLDDVVAGVSWDWHGYFQHRENVEPLSDPDERRRTPVTSSGLTAAGEAAVGPGARGSLS